MKRYVRTISYFLSLLAVAAIFFSVEFVIEKFLCPNDEIVDIIAAIAGAMSFSECRRFFDRITDTLFFRGERDVHAELLANLYHELQTPIAILRGNVELLHMRSIPEEQRTAAERVVVTTLDGMSRLIGNFLESAKLKFSKKIWYEKDVAMGALLRETHEDTLLLAEDKGIRFSVIIDAQNEARLIVRGDRDKLKEVLFNLISNALKHTPLGGSISFYAKKNGHEAQIIVEDSGRGMAPDDLGHIFERFYRIKSGMLAFADMHGGISSHGGESSTGIGLNICREIIEAHGGRITVESEIGKGTRFIIHLPIAPS